MISLFGDEIPDVGKPVGREKKTGHAAAPGTGPAGETCKTCVFYTIVKPGANKFRKCGHPISRKHWTHGPGTDIKASDPACHFWKSAKESAIGTDEDGR